MKEYKCIKDFYIEDVKIASKGDVVKLLQDGTTVIISPNGDQKTAPIKEMLDNKDHFIIYKGRKDFLADNKVNHPDHYTWLKKLCGIEVIDITRHMDFCLGNAIKYILRAGHKSEEGMSDKEKTIQDLKKAVWYINDEIKQLENGTIYNV